MIRSVLWGALFLAFLDLGGAQAAPVYAGWSINGGAVTTFSACNGASGTCTVTNTVVGSLFDIMSLTVTGTPPSPEPDIATATTDINSRNTGILTLYVSELNQFPTGFSFQSIFGDTSPAGDNWSVTESTYVTSCIEGSGNPCTASDKFAEGNLLSTTTFTGAGANVTMYAGFPAGVSTTPYVTTLVYTINANVADQEFQGSINLSSTPLPGALPLFVGGLGAMGLFGWRRRRKNTATVAA